MINSNVRKKLSKNKIVLTISFGLPILCNGIIFDSCFLALGFFLVYIYQPRATIIYVYPTPENLDRLHIKDKANNCFNFEMQEMACPSDSNLISTIPAQY